MPSDLGEAITVNATFAADGTLTDPAALTLAVRSPAGVTTTYTYPDDAAIVRDGAGEYHAALTPNAAGEWRYAWTGTVGTSPAVQTGSFTVGAAWEISSPSIFGVEYQPIRDAIGADFTSREIPDALIASLVHLPAAEAEVLALDPVATTRTGPDLERIRRAVTFLTAARLVMVVPLVQEQSEAGVKQEQFAVIHPGDRAKELRGLAMRELGGLGVSTPATPRFTYTAIDWSCRLW
jgi:hypothetical protein